MGRSKERVRQLRNKLGLLRQPLKALQNKCVDCGIQVTWGLRRCPACREKVKTRDTVVLYCTQCGGRIVRKSYHARPGARAFCNKHCHGRWLAANYGFQTGHLLNSRPPSLRCLNCCEPTPITRVIHYRRSGQTARVLYCKYCGQRSYYIYDAGGTLIDSKLRY